MTRDDAPKGMPGVPRVRVEAESVVNGYRAPHQIFERSSLQDDRGASGLEFALSRTNNLSSILN